MRGKWNPADLLNITRRPIRATEKQIRICEQWLYFLCFKAEMAEILFLSLSKSLNQRKYAQNKNIVWSKINYKLDKTTKNL